MQSVALDPIVPATKSPAGAITARSGPVQVLTNTLQHGGMRALYTGLALPLTAQCVYKATVFCVNNVCQEQIVDYKSRDGYRHELTMMDRLISGALGGAVNGALFVTPVEYVRNQLIRQHSEIARGASIERKFRGPMDVIKVTISKQGVTGLWRGLGMTVARDSLGCAFFFASMAHCQKTLTKKDSQPSFSVTVLSGGIAGLGYWFVALPLDTVKTWIQNGTAPSAIVAIRESIKTHGPEGAARQLCRGWEVAFGRGLPSAAITIATYDWFYKRLSMN